MQLAGEMECMGEQGRAVAMAAPEAVLSLQQHSIVRWLTGILCPAACRRPHLGCLATV